jgi:uncharacterized protein (TIGR04255 family)
MASTFPKVEEHPPYVTPVERFDSTDIAREIAFEFSEAMPTPRMWFVSRDGQELVQIQRDWLACNWRKVRPEDTYGRWPSRRKEFVKWFGEFEKFVAGTLRTPITVTQCEVTYVNQIEPNEYWSAHGDVSNVLRIVGSAEGKQLRKPEQVQLAASYLITGDDRKPVGRLHVTVQPAIRRDDKAPILVVNLTARGKPEGDGTDGVLRFLDRGRHWIVQGFTDLTTVDMHRVWGIENV